MTETSPKLFVSYSWSSPTHEEWVLKLATELRGVGIDVVLDKWDLKEGHDANAFMERMVTDPHIKKVILVCDRMYAEKADRRKGGVGTEAQIISPEIYAKTEQDKFVAVVAELNEHGQEYIPTYYKGRIHIDLSDDSLYAANFEQLVRWVYDKPLNAKPSLGKKPAFISNPSTITAILPTGAHFRRALDTVRNGRAQAKGAIDDYLEILSSSFEQLRIVNVKGEFDDAVIESINNFLSERTQFIELVFAIAKYRPNVDSWQQLHRFIEQLIPFLDRPPSMTSWKKWDFDNYRFIVHELFLYIIAILLKRECFDGVAHLLRQQYYVQGNSNYGRTAMVSFVTLRRYVEAFNCRNKRLNLQRLSLRADLLKKRTEASGLDFNHLMQADFVLWCRATLDTLCDRVPGDWWPETLIYADRFAATMEVFARAQSRSYFEKMKGIFEVQKREDLDIIPAALKDGRITLPRWDFYSFDPAVLLGIEQLATRP